MPGSGSVQPVRCIATSVARARSSASSAIRNASRIAGAADVARINDAEWVARADLRVAALTAPPPGVGPEDRWFDIDLDEQVLIAYEGERPVYATLVSTGKDGLGDPRHTQSTPQGTFAIQRKHVTTTMDSDAADAEFELRDVPWVMYFKGGYALHGAYWHDDFGSKRSHGCINLAPLDARHVFEWSLPHVPEHWHGAYASDGFGAGTTLRIGR